MTIADDYFSAKWVDVIFVKEWIGWYDVVNPVGKKTKVKKFKNRYYDARGHGDPIDDITEYVKEIDVKENKNVK